MQPSRTCQYCGVIFQNIKGRVFSNHVRWCHKNPSRQNTQRISEATRRSYDKKLGQITSFDVSCQRCDKKFSVQERANQFPRKDAYFCSRSCANKRTLDTATKQKIRNSVMRQNKKNNRTAAVYEKQCPQCNTTFETKRGTQQFCSVKCVAQSRVKNPDSLNYYRRQCAFQFALKNYPDEFDFPLIEKYGWYSPTNKRNNLGGVSRDHMVSVRYGYDNNVDPQILAHPANCRLVLHNQNVSKHTACSISLGGLKQRIQKWDVKYGPFAEF